VPPQAYEYSKKVFKLIITNRRTIYKGIETQNMLELKLTTA